MVVITLKFEQGGFTIECVGMEQTEWFFFLSDFCFTALQHILGHFGHGQLT